MKPASIISMIVAVLLIIAGFVTCLIAQNMAEAEGQMLFAENRDYGLVNTLDLAETAISKLEINVQDADVHIYGGSESSYIELVNFRENYYSCNTSNRVVTFDEVPDVTSMLKFWENGVSFKGIRYLLTFGEEEPEGDKVINVYLGGENIDLKIVSITGKTCNVSLENMTYSADYTITLEEGSLHSKNMKTSSQLTVAGNKVALDLQDSSFNTCNLQCTDLTLDVMKVYMPMTTIQCTTIDADITPTQTIASLNYEVAVKNGSVTVNGNNLGTGFVQNASSNNRFELKADSGAVLLNDPPKEDIKTWPPTAD